MVSKAILLACLSVQHTNDGGMYCKRFGQRITNCPKACAGRELAQPDLFTETFASTYDRWKQENRAVFNWISREFLHRAQTNPVVSVRDIFGDARHAFKGQARMDGSPYRFNNNLTAELSRDLQRIYPDYAHKIKTRRVM